MGVKEACSISLMHCSCIYALFFSVFAVASSIGVDVGWGKWIYNERACSMHGK